MRKSTQKAIECKQAAQLHRRGAKMMSRAAPARENDTKETQKMKTNVHQGPATTALARPARTINC